MYPNLYYAFRDLFGVEWMSLRFVNSFGFFVAIGFILAAVVLVTELKRKSKQGLLQPTEMQIMVGQPATASELALNFLLGFLPPAMTRRHSYFQHWEAGRLVLVWGSCLQD